VASSLPGAMVLYPRTLDRAAGAQAAYHSIVLINQGRREAELRRRQGVA